MTIKYQEEIIGENFFNVPPLVFDYNSNTIEYMDRAQGSEKIRQIRYLNLSSKKTY